MSVAYSLNEGHDRGFFSNLTTVLTCARFLVENHNVDLSDIFMSSNLFSLYGDPRIWFDADIVSDNGTSISALTGFNLSQHPSNKELDLGAYLQRFRWNSRITNFLQNSRPITPKTLGIHYRGTDHNINDYRHGPRVDPGVFLAMLQQLYEEQVFNSVYICSDEQDTIEYLRTKIQQTYNLDVYLTNATRLTASTKGLHWRDTNLNKVKIADEVILDAWYLSQCSTIIAKTSNLVNYARIVNPQIQVYYADLPNNLQQV